MPKSLIYYAVVITCLGLFVKNWANEFVGICRVRIIESAIVLFGVPLTAWMLLAEDHLASYLSEVAPVLAVRTIAVLFLLVIALLAWIFYVRPWLKFDGALGVYRDTKSGVAYCTSCRTGFNRLSPLQEKEDGWYCRVRDCQQVYRNPLYSGSRKPSITRKPSGYL